MNQVNEDQQIMQFTDLIFEIPFTFEQRKELFKLFLKLDSKKQQLLSEKLAKTSKRIKQQSDHFNNRLKDDLYHFHRTWLNLSDDISLIARTKLEKISKIEDKQIYSTLLKKIQDDDLDDQY